MRRTGIAILTLVVLTFTACQEHKPETTRLQTDDIVQVTGQITDKLASSDFLRERGAQSTPIIITCRRAENLSLDLIEEPELWMFVQKIESNINSGNLCRSKAIVFQIPPERVEMLRRTYPEVASGAQPATHTMNCSIRSASRVTNDKEGYVNNQVRLYYFDYNILRLADGKLEWIGSAEFQRKAAGKLGD